MEDIVPALYKKIKSDFDNQIKKDIEIQEILNDKRKETSFEDISFLSGRIGRYASKSLTKYITKENMPDGRLYWNILERTIVPLMKEVYDLINELAIYVQLKEDAKQKIGIKPVKADFPQERIETVMNKLMALQEEVISDGQQ